MAPGFPFVVSLAYRIAGNEDAAIFILGCFLSVVVAALIYWMPRIAVRLGLEERHGLLASLAFVFPVFPWIEISAQHESVLTAAALLTGLAITVPWIREGKIDWKHGALMGLVWGIAVHISPILLMVCGATGIVALVRWRARPQALAQFVLACVAAFALAVTPYTIRNLRVMHGFFFIRDDFPLELAMSNADNATLAADDNFARGRAANIHPYMRRSESMRVKRIGEVEYNRRRGKDAKAWIAAHPAKFARWSAARTVMFFAPPAVHWYTPVLFASAAIAALVGAALLARRSWFDAAILAGSVAAFAAPYSLVEIDARYCYPTLWLEVLLAAYAVMLVVSRQSSVHGSQLTVHSER
jgi:hypothetical protein